MNSKLVSNAGYEELRRKMAVAETLHTLGEKIIGNFAQVLSREFELKQLRIGVHRTDPREHDTHEHSEYWFEIKDCSVDPPVSIKTSVTLDRGRPFIQYMVVDESEKDPRAYLPAIERITAQLAEHVQLLEPAVDYTRIREHIRKTMER